MVQNRNTEDRRVEGLVNDQQWLLIALKRLSVDLVVFEHQALNGKDGKSSPLRDKHIIRLREGPKHRSSLSGIF